MSKITERRDRILQRLSFERHVTVSALMDEFNVSRNTIKNDIYELSLSFPVHTQKGYRGGIFVSDGWRYSNTYMSEKEIQFLRYVSEGMCASDKRIMEAIIRRFSLPKEKEACNK